MSRVPPKDLLNLLAHSNSPAEMLRRLSAGSSNDECLGPQIVQGGTARERMDVELRSSGQGDRITHQFVVSSLHMSGGKLDRRPKRYPVTAQDVREMLAGDRERPEGVSRDVLRTALPILTKCEKNRHARVHEHDRHQVRQVARCGLYR